MDSNQLRRQLSAAGYKLEPTGSGHTKVTDSVDGRVVGTIATSPSDVRSLQNQMSDLRRAGVDLTRRLGRDERKARSAEGARASQRVAQVIEAAESFEQLTPSMVAELLEVSRGNADQILQAARKAGAIKRISRGVYARRVPTTTQAAPPAEAETPVPSLSETVTAATEAARDGAAAAGAARAVEVNKRLDEAIAAPPQRENFVRASDYWKVRAELDKVRAQLAGTASWSIVATDPNSSVVLRDPEGNLWVAAQLNTAFLALGQQTRESTP